jgi:hypothetical protein
MALYRLRSRCGEKAWLLRIATKRRKLTLHQQGLSVDQQRLLSLSARSATSGTLNSSVQEWGMLLAC